MLYNLKRASTDPDHEYQEGIRLSAAVVANVVVESFSVFSGEDRGQLLVELTLEAAIVSRLAQGAHRQREVHAKENEAE